MSSNEVQRLIGRAQETNLLVTMHVAFQDAILLDMLLDLIADDFIPYQRRLDDGFEVQLEIL